MTQLVTGQPTPAGTGASSYCLQLGSTAQASMQTIAMVYLVAVVELGTGGAPRIDWSRAHARTGPFVFVREATAPVGETFSTADRVLLLRRWFSLTVAEAARVLQVQRPTIYSWQDGNAPAAPKNLERLRTVFELAQEWRARSAAPVGNQRKEPLGPSARTLVDLLTAEEISRASVLETLDRIAEHMDRPRPRRAASAAELARRYGFKPLSDSDASRSIAQESAASSPKTGRS